MPCPFVSRIVLKCLLQIQDRIRVILLSVCFITVIVVRLRHAGTLPDEIDHHISVDISTRADRYIMTKKVGNVVFDFERTTFMDSSGIGIILGRYKKIACFGGKVYAINADNPLLSSYYPFLSLSLQSVILFSNPAKHGILSNPRCPYLQFLRVVCLIRNDLHDILQP